MKFPLLIVTADFDTLTSVLLIPFETTKRCLGVSIGYSLPEISGKLRYFF